MIFRPSFVFERDGGILPTFRKLAKLAPVTPIIGSGEQRIQPIWVDDVAAYFDAGARRSRRANRTFELGGPDVVSWNEFWQRLEDVARNPAAPSIHVPVGLMRVNALVTERLPGNIPLTRDLLKMLEHGDNVVSERRRRADVPAPARATRRAVAPGRLTLQTRIRDRASRQGVQPSSVAHDRSLDRGSRRSRSPALRCSSPAT